MVLGWSRQILLLTSRIWIASQAVPPDYGVMAVLSLYLIVLSILATAAQRSVLARRSYVTVTGKGFRPRPIDLGRLSALTLLTVVCALLGVAGAVNGERGNLTSFLATLGVLAGLVSVVVLFGNALCGI